MKLRRVAIRGFRGALVLLDFRPQEKSWCVIAENGRGKTTIVDALEFWSAGDIDFYHREGYGLDALVNVDASEAVVTCETSVPSTLERSLKDDRVSALRAVGPVPVGGDSPPPIPVLRHRTMAHFMEMSPGDKKKTLLDLFGLSEMTPLRQALRTATNTADEKLDALTRRLVGEQRAVQVLTGGSDATAAAEQLRREAGLTKAISSRDDLLGVELDREAVRSLPDRTSPVVELTRALSAVNDAERKAWNGVVGDARLLEAQLVGDVLGAASRVLAKWTRDVCPLCEQPVEPGELQGRIQARMGELSALRVRFVAAERSLDSFIRGIDVVVSAVTTVIGAAPPLGWPQPSRLTQLRSSYAAYVSALRKAKSERAMAEPTPNVDLPDLARLKSTAEASVAAESTQRALLKLVRLQDQARRTNDVFHQCERAYRVAGVARKMLATADRELQRMTEEALKRIGALAADYYGRLTQNPVYRGVGLVYRDERAGGIEFELDFDGRHRIAPPQRVMSESQLNALGLALFLARLKVEPQPWRTLVLDDVVNSFDADHRASLARILQEEFADWQVLVFTHDRVFAGVLQRMMKGWRYTEIVAWSPASGPVLLDGDSLEQLATRLAEGRSAGEVAGLARVALEQALSRPLEKLEFDIRYDSLGRYAAGDYLAALRSGLNARNPALARLPVLGRIDASSYLVNLGAHDRPADPALTTGDLRAMVDDLRELREAFLCAACKEPVWFASHDRGRRHQCKCAALSV